MYFGIIIAFVAFAALIYIGYYLTKKGVLHPSSCDDLSAILVKVLVPFSILAAGNQQSEGNSLSALIVIFIIVSCFYIIGNPLLYFLFKLITKDKNLAGQYSNLAVYANVGFIGFPLTLALLGQEAQIYTVIFNLCYNLYFYSLGVKFFGAKATLGKVLVSPIMLSAYAAIILFVSPYKLPVQVVNIISNVGNATLPVSMFIIGSWLVGADIKELVRLKSGYLVNAVRLIVMPLLMLLVLKAFNLPQESILPLVLVSALPIGSMNVIMAKQFNLDYKNSNAILMQSMVLCIFTIPIIMVIAYNLI